MERRSCTNLHFINAIKGSSVAKICNVSFGKPALKFKKLEDIYESLTSCTRSVHHSTSEFGYNKVKIENVYAPVVERRLWEVETANRESLQCGTDGSIGSDSDDYTFGKMTLKELKKDCKAKKRKRVSAVEPEEDDPDLKEPLISWKLKVPKAKKKCSGSPKTSVSIKFESEDLESERPLQFEVGLLPSVHVKTEVTESEVTVCQNMIPSDYSFTVNQKDESGLVEVISERNPFYVECPSSESNLCVQSCGFSEVSYDHLNDAESLPMLPNREEIMDVEDQENEVTESEMTGCQNVIPSGYSFTVNLKDESGIVEVISERNPLYVECLSSESDLCVQSCALNEVSYDHLNDAASFPMLPYCEEIMDVKDQEKWCQQFLQLPMPEYGKEKKNSASPIKDQSEGWNGCSRSSDLDEFSGHSSSSPAVVTHTFGNDIINIEETYCAGDSMHLQDPYTDAELFSSNDDISEEKQPLECRTIDGAYDNLNNGSQLDVMEDDLSSGEERQPPISASTDAENAERDSIPCCQEYVLAGTSSSSVAVQVPERLLSTRKVVSPTSEERFSLAISSAGSCGDTELLDCKEDICNEKQTEIQSSCEKSDKHENVSKSPQATVAVSRMKFILSSSQIRRKAKHEKTSPPKGNREGSRISRSLSRVNTGCTSVEGCSESAITFSRRQMQDIESLANKLMSELKSMKDIVEDKLLFEAYRNLSTKNDADEVKNAITNATKAEDMAKKWLSIMGRDCNRFCKIMSLRPNGNTGVASNNTVQRDKKRITFADEAGGMLCHVKFFENGETSPEPEV